MKNKNYFTKINNNLFYSNKEEINILKECNYDYKVLLILDYLYTNTNRKEISIFTLEDMIINCGYKVDNHKNKTNDKFKDILSKLQELKIIENVKDLKTIKLKEFIKCTVNLFTQDEKGNDIRFIQLFDTEKEKIFTYSSEKIDNLKLLYYYCYLKARMYKRTKDDDLVVKGGRAEVCYPSYKKINEDIGLTDEIIKKYNDILIELNLIRVDNAGLWYYKDDKNKMIRESSNIYTLYAKQKDEWENNLKEGIKFYKKLYSDERVFTNSRKYKNNNKKINGYIARVEYLEQQGKATQKQIEKKNNYKKSADVDEKIKRKISIFEKEENKGLILSEIFDNYGNEKKFNKVLNFEKSLGLLDKDDNMTVEYDYYKWIVTNYEKDKHDYFVNCVKKHIEMKNHRPVGLQNTKKAFGGFYKKVKKHNK